MNEAFEKIGNKLAVYEQRQVFFERGGIADSFGLIFFDLTLQTSSPPLINFVSESAKGLFGNHVLETSADLLRFIHIDDRSLVDFDELDSTFRLRLINETGGFDFWILSLKRTDHRLFGFAHKERQLAGFGGLA